MRDAYSRSTACVHAPPRTPPCTKAAREAQRRVRVQGLNAALVEWVDRHGWGVLVPFITLRTDAAFNNYITHKNNTVPWCVSR